MLFLRRDLFFGLSTCRWTLEEDMATHSSNLALRIPTDRGACWAAVHGVTESRTRLSDQAQQTWIKSQFPWEKLQWLSWEFTRAFLRKLPYYFEASRTWSEIHSFWKIKIQSQTSTTNTIGIEDPLLFPSFPNKQMDISQQEILESIDCPTLGVF